MIIHKALAVAAAVLVLGPAGTASAQAPEDGPSMSSPYVPNVPHVPSSTLLVLGPGGSLEGAEYVSPRGSLFNGRVDEVATRVDSWWAEKMAEGVTPVKADALLAGLAW